MINKYRTSLIPFKVKKIKNEYSEYVAIVLKIIIFLFMTRHLFECGFSEIKQIIKQVRYSLFRANSIFINPN